MLAGFQLTEYLARVATGQAVDELVLRVRDQADEAAPDLRVAVGLLRVDEEHGQLAVALQVLRPGAPGVAAEPEEPVFELEPDRVQLHRAAVPPGRDHDEDRQRRQLPDLRAERRRLLSASHRSRRSRAAARSAP